MVHVRAGHHGVKTRERDAVIGLHLLVCCRGQNRRHVDAVVHLFDAGGKNQVAGTRGDLQERLTQRGASRRARRLDATRRNAGLADLLGHQRPDVFLVHEQARRHVAHVNRINPLGTRVIECGQCRLGEEVAEARLPKFAEARHSGPDDGHLTHGLLLS